MARPRPGGMPMGRWSRRRLLRHGATILALAVGGPALTACGFRPLYGARAGGTAAADLALAQIVYERARKEGRGMEIELPAPGTQ